MARGDGRRKTMGNPPSNVQAVLVLTTLGAEVNAASFARTLVEEGLAACVNVLPAMTSTYRWKGAIEQEREQQVIIKTVEGSLAELDRRVHELHPYDLPEFLVIRVSSGSDAYLRWLAENVESRS